MQESLFLSMFFYFATQHQCKSSDKINNKENERQAGVNAICSSHLILLPFPGLFVKPEPRSHKGSKHQSASSFDEKTERVFESRKNETDRSLTAVEMLNILCMKVTGQ
jgi:hypothetical protein